MLGAGTRNWWLTLSSRQRCFLSGKLVLCGLSSDTALNIDVFHQPRDRAAGNTEPREAHLVSDLAHAIDEL